MQIPKYIYLKDRKDERSLSSNDGDVLEDSSLAVSGSHSFNSLNSSRSRWDASEAATCGRRPTNSALNFQWEMLPSSVHSVISTGAALTRRVLAPEPNTPARTKPNRTDQKLELSSQRCFPSVAPRPRPPSRSRLTYSPPGLRRSPKQTSVRAPKAPLRQLSMAASECSSGCFDANAKQLQASPATDLA